MSMFDDIIKRHKETEDMRKKVKDSKAGKDPLDMMMMDMAKILQDSTQHTFSYGGVGNTVGNLHTPNNYIFPPGMIATPSSQKAKPVAPKPPIPKKKVEFDSVVLAPEKKQAVIEALDQIGNHKLIFETWGFGKTLEKGKAVSMLFYGPPGTGKTLMAQAIADKLEKKLKVIGSAEIESSEPGAAERNIKAFFEQTKKDTILLFDECDSLIYDRASLGSILAAQVNQLLSSLENYEGVVIFTTNRLGVLDEAFNRRLSLKLEFELPNFEERVNIWKRMFPKEAPLGKINWEQLAEVEIAGGHIKNAVLRAARTAASSKVKKITQEILVQALRSEVIEMVKFMDARDNTNHLPRQTGYTLRKG